MTRVLRWAVLGAAVAVQFGCNDIGSGVYLLGNCTRAASHLCTEIRTNVKVVGPDRDELHQSEETACDGVSGVYVRDEICGGTDTATHSCVKRADETLSGTSVTVIRSLLYLSGYSSGDDFQTESDDCEATGGEFRDTSYVPPPAG